MCEACERRHGSMLMALLPFLKDDVQAHFTHEADSCPYYGTDDDVLKLTRPGLGLKLSTSGTGQASYFHWEPLHESSMENQDKSLIHMEN